MRKAPSPLSPQETAEKALVLLLKPVVVPPHKRERVIEGLRAMALAQQPDITKSREAVDA